jgi:ubiquinone/menaquinone biosynthesis C-methylase UbiE
MKQNIYDDPVFFAGYQALRKNEAGLNAAIEEPAVRSVLPDLTAMTILDLGSGCGEFCRFARARGAVSVTGVDISARMLAEAKIRTGDSGITYIKAAIEDYPIDGNAFDLIVSRLTLHYIKDYRGVVLAAFHGLREGGAFVFSVEHPVCTALLHGWQEDKNGNQLFWPVDDYQMEGERTQHWFVDGVVKHHRTVETYVNTLLEAGFHLTRLLEPHAGTAIPADRPDLAGAARRPPLLVLAARKPASAGAADTSR